MNSDGTDNINLTNSPGSDEVAPGFSPDGRQIAFSSDQDGDPEIFVMNRDGGDPRQLTHNTWGDDNPSWGHNGLEIVYVSGERYVGSRLLGLSAINGEIIHEFGDFAAAVAYDTPVWAATEHVLVPSQEAVAAGESNVGGFVRQGRVLKLNLGTPNPPSQESYSIKRQPKSRSSSYHREIFQAAPNFVPPPINWSPTIGSLGYSD